MALDGSRNSRLISGVDTRRLRPASREFASLNFPTIIFLFKKKQLDLRFFDFPGEYKYISIKEKGIGKKRDWIMLTSDFEICKEISKSVSRFHPNEPDEVYLDRIKSKVLSYF